MIMQEALTEEQKITYANDVENAAVHLMDTIRKIGRPLSVMISSDGKTRVHLANMRDIVDRAPGELNTIHRDTADFPFKYVREYNGLTFFSFDVGREES